MNLDFKSQSELYEMRYPVAFGYELELDPNCRFHPEIFEKYIKSLKNGDNFEGTIAIGVKMINQDSVVSINTKDKSTVIPLNDAITIITILKMLASQNYDIVNDREDQINDKDQRIHIRGLFLPLLLAASALPCSKRSEHHRRHVFGYLLSQGMLHQLRLVFMSAPAQIWIYLPGRRHV